MLENSSLPQLTAPLLYLWSDEFLLIHLFTYYFAFYVNKYTSVKIKPELHKNILKFCYGINYKYEGMLAHSFDRFYVVTKYILPMIDDLKLSPINYDKGCKYLNDLDDNEDEQIKMNIKDLMTYCVKRRTYMAFYKMQINACNKTARHILKNEVDLILPKFPEDRKSKRGMFSAIISGFIGLAFEGIPSFLYSRRHKAVCTMSATKQKIISY